MEGKFPRAGAYFTVRAWIRAAGRGVKTAADIARGTWILCGKSAGWAVKSTDCGGGGVGACGRGKGSDLWDGGQLECPILPDSANRCGVQVTLA
jgi:hypothetical protein